MSKHEKEVQAYIDGVLDGTLIVGEDQKKMVNRFLRFKDKYDYKTKPADDVIDLIETTLTHKQGEDIEGNPLKGKPLLLLPFQKFIVYGIMSFYFQGTKNRVTKEVLIFIPRKNGKTTFVAGLAWALSLYYRKSGSKCYIVANALQQSMESFRFILENVREMGLEFKIKDNNIEHSIDGQFNEGSIFVRALASSVDKQDSLNANIIIADELHAYRTPKQYKIMKDATKAYTNKLVIGISTAGDNPNGYLAQRIEYTEKILDETVESDDLFIFLSRMEKDGDFSDEKQHRIANPAYGVTIRPDDIKSDALEALNDPQTRKEFLAKSLNVFTGSMNSYFEVEEFQESNQESEEKLGINPVWTLEQKYKHLTKLPIEWFGGADLSRVHDLTASSLYGEYKGVGIAITHAFFPITSAHTKADEDGIPLLDGKKMDGLQ